MEAVVVEREGGAVTVTLNRPQKKNALTGAMIAELRAVFEEIDARPEDRAMVLTGAGDSFCSGADLSGRDSPATAGSASTLAAVRRVGDLAVALHRLSKPSIAKVDGIAVGAGLGLALGCDLVVASERAMFSMIFSKRALCPDNATSWLLPRLVGMARAKELALFGSMIDADRASALGLVNAVVGVDELDAFVRTWARTLAEGPALAFATTKMLLSSAWSVSLAEAVELEAQCQAANLSGPDVKEAIAAFLEKRTPRYAAPRAPS